MGSRAAPCAAASGAPTTKRAMPTPSQTSPRFEPVLGAEDLVAVIPKRARSRRESHKAPVILLSGHIVPAFIAHRNVVCAPLTQTGTKEEPYERREAGRKQRRLQDVTLPSAPAARRLRRNRATRPERGGEDMRRIVGTVFRNGKSSSYKNVHPARMVRAAVIKTLTTLPPNPELPPVRRFNVLGVAVSAMELDTRGCRHLRRIAPAPRRRPSPASTACIMESQRRRTPSFRAILQRRAP